MKCYILGVINRIPNLKQLSLLLILCLLLLGLDSIKLLSLPKTVVLYITNPVAFALYKAEQNLARQFYFVFAARFAAQENKALKEQLGLLLSENTVLKKRLAEAETELDQVNFISPRTYNLQPARPIGVGRFLRIDKGSNDGIKVGQAVISRDNYIGQIHEVSPKSSNVLLLLDPDSKIAAFSQGINSHAKGVVVGQFGTEAVMDKILHEESVVIDDLVYSEGTEGFLPRGLILGRIIEVVDNQSGIFKVAKIKPVFDIRDLELVFVMVGG